MRSLSTRTTGLLIVILGVWGGLVPFVGPYFHFALGPDQSWKWTSGRFFLSVLPGIVAVVGGLMLVNAGPRPHARLGALLAIAAGIWFAIGPDVSYLWTAGALGVAHGSKGIRVLEMLTYHTGLGAVIAALGGYALPRFVAAGAVVAEPAAVAPAAGARRPAPAAGRRPGAVASEPVNEREPVSEPVTTAAPAASEARAADGVPDRTTEPVGDRTSDQPVADEAGTPVAGRTGEYAGTTAPLANRTNEPATTGRRRRGGLLSSLVSRH